MQVALRSLKVQLYISQPCPLLSNILEEMEKVGRYLDFGCILHACPIDNLPLPLKHYYAAWRAMFTKLIGAILWFLYL